MGKAAVNVKSGDCQYAHQVCDLDAQDRMALMIRTT